MDIIAISVFLGVVAYCATLSFVVCLGACPVHGPKTPKDEFGVETRTPYDYSMPPDPPTYRGDRRKSRE